MNTSNWRPWRTSSKTTWNSRWPAARPQVHRRCRHHGGARRQAGEMKPEELVASIQPRIRVEPDHHFAGFDAYQKLLASDVDIVMLCTPPGYRPMHFEAAVNAGKHVFTEKPIATDPVGARRFIAAAKLAAERKLTVVSGAQRHAHREYVETVQKIHDGAIGDIVSALFLLPQRPGLSRRPPRSQVGRHGVGASQLVLVHLDLRRPDRRAALPQHRFHELGDGRASGEGGGVGRRGMAPARGTLRQYLRSHELRFHLSEWRAPVAATAGNIPRASTPM